MSIIIGLILMVLVWNTIMGALNLVYNIHETNAKWAAVRRDFIIDHERKQIRVSAGASLENLQSAKISANNHKYDLVTIY